MAELKLVKVSEIRPNTYNPNKMSDRKFRALKKNISEGGMLQPILITEDGEIIDGYHRWKASNEVGLKEIHAVVVKDTDEGRKLKTISMNKLRGKHNPTLFADLLDELNKKYDMQEIGESTGLDEDYLYSILDLKGIDDIDLSFGEFEIDGEDKMGRYTAIFDNRSSIPMEYATVIVEGLKKIEKMEMKANACEILLVYLMYLLEGGAE